MESGGLRLSGLRVVVTRASHQAEELARPLRESGAEVLLLPVIQIAPPADTGPLQRAVADCTKFDWVIFSSTNAVEAFVAQLPVRSISPAKIATVGDATRQACEEAGLPVSLTPEQYVAEALVEAFAQHDLTGQRILVPSAAVSRDVIPGELRKQGADVLVVEAYRNIVPAEALSLVDRVLREPYPDWLLFASSSAVKNLVALAGVERVNRMRVASIGPATTATAQALGVWITAEAEPHDVNGLVAAVFA